MSLLLTFNIANNLSNPSLQPAMATFWPTLQHFFSIKTTLNLGTLQSLHAGVPISLLCQRLDTFKKKFLSVKLLFILFIIDVTL